MLDSKTFLASCLQIAHDAKLGVKDNANKPNTQVRLQGVRIYERLEQNQNIHSVLHERRHNNKASQGIVDHMANNMSNCKQPDNSDRIELFKEPGRT